MSELPIRLWLDDMRPAPPGWIHVKTDHEARAYLVKRDVAVASLDHDLGACEVCLDGLTPEAWLERSGYQSMPHCEHFGTGYTLVCWMEETDNWPGAKPTVHSANPVGRARMQMVIDRKFGSV